MFGNSQTVEYYMQANINAIQKQPKSRRSFIQVYHNKFYEQQQKELKRQQEKETILKQELNRQQNHDKIKHALRSVSLDRDDIKRFNE